MKKMDCETRMGVEDGLSQLGNTGKLVDRLSRTDHGPFLILFSLFLFGFCPFTGCMLLMVSMWLPALVVFVLIFMLGSVVGVIEKWDLFSQKRDSKGIILKERAKWMIILGWLLPQEHRDAILGDIMEDYHEMIESGLSKRQIRTHVLWQWMIAVVTLFPSFVVRVVNRLWRTP